MFATFTVAPPFTQPMKAVDVQHTDDRRIGAEGRQQRVGTTAKAIGRSALR